MKHNSKEENHLDIYLERYELHQDNVVTTYYQGVQSNETQQRYAKIKSILSGGYLDSILLKLPKMDFSKLSEVNRNLLRSIVNGITSETGRALVGILFLQLVVKSIAPEQSIRLHKGTNRKGSFSWVEGISMRTIDTSFCTPFLRKQGFLKLNKYGVFMTRSLAENYPYSVFYKAEMKGPFAEWLEIVDLIEDNSLPAELGLSYLIVLLKNKSESFENLASNLISIANNYQKQSFDEVSFILKEFFNNTIYSARAFEVVIHCFLQAMAESGYLGELNLAPLSQMRSANKKHGNIGDVELREGGVVVESWDAKYGKTYLRDELEELRDKILLSPGLRIAGFIVNDDVDRRRDVIHRKLEIEAETGVKIHLFSFDEWKNYQVSIVPNVDLDVVAPKWLRATVESFAQKRPTIAPIDEPCENWLEDLAELLKG